MPILNRLKAITDIARPNISTALKRLFRFLAGDVVERDMAILCFGNAVGILDDGNGHGAEVGGAMSFLHVVGRTPLQGASG